jgi:hypothetical protein
MNVRFSRSSKQLPEESKTLERNIKEANWTYDLLLFEVNYHMQQQRRSKLDFLILLSLAHTPLFASI